MSKSIITPEELKDTIIAYSFINTFQKKDIHEKKIRAGLASMISSATINSTRPIIYVAQGDVKGVIPYAIQLESIKIIASSASKIIKPYKILKNVEVLESIDKLVKNYNPVGAIISFTENNEIPQTVLNTLNKNDYILKFDENKNPKNFTTSIYQMNDNNKAIKLASKKNTPYVFNEKVFNAMASHTKL